jgi:hypothetical protein
MRSNPSASPVAPACTPNAASRLPTSTATPARARAEPKLAADRYQASGPASENCRTAANAGPMGPGPLPTL